MQMRKLICKKNTYRKEVKMLTLLITLVIMYVGIIGMILTDENKKKYTNYQIRKILKQSKLFA